MAKKSSHKGNAGNLVHSLRNKMVGGAWFVTVIVILYFILRFIAASNAAETHARIEAVNREQLMTVVLPKEMKSVKCIYKGYTAHFNPDLHIPNVVIYELTGTEAEGALPRYKNFMTDDTVPGCATPQDYSYSGFDRGHMAPAADMKWDEDAMRESFYMTNICPQVKALNTGAWNKLEGRVREWAKRDSVLIVATGPIIKALAVTRYDDSVDDVADVSVASKAASQSGGAIRTIGDSKVAVPEQFFKIVLASHTKPMRAIAFIYDNAKATGSLESHAVSVDVVEEATGIDFFSSLPDDVEDVLESQCDVQQWSQRK